MVLTVLLMGCALAQSDGHNAAFATTAFSCTLGDNAAMGDHQDCYNGVYDIIAADLAESPFVRAYAGLNLEHYFDARSRLEDGALFFEPRHAPMTFTRRDAAGAELFQPETPFWGMESRSCFELQAPDAIDLHFRCKAAKQIFQGGFFGVFWASYINAPEDKSLYFLGEGASLEEPRWEQLCTQKHGVASTVVREDDTFAIPFAEPGELLYANFALMKYSVPMFYGRFRDRVLIYLFKPGPDTLVRFAQSPSGGGGSEDGTTTNPAWDFQMIVPNPELGKEYSLEMRLVYKRWNGRADVLRVARDYLE